MQYRLGLDIGIASVGYAVLACDNNGEPYRIVRMGSRVFDKLENAKDGKSLALPRREARGVRRRLRRRAHRLERAKYCFSKYLAVSSLCPCDVYYLRYFALDNAISDSELASVLYSLIKRRGFKSNRKSENSNKDTGKLLTSTNANVEYRKAMGYRTVGEMFYLDSKYSTSYMNSDGVMVKQYNTRNKVKSYDHCILRVELEQEMRQILLNQQQLGNTKVTQQFIEEILSIFNSQRAFDEGPGYPSPYSGTFAVGDCTLLPQYKRAPKASYTAEYSKCLQTLNGIKISTLSQSIELTSEQRQLLLGHIVTKGKITYAQVRKYLNLTDAQTFNMVNYSSRREDSVETAEKRIAFSMIESMSIRKCLTEEHVTDVDLIDEIAVLLSYNKSDDKITNEISQNEKLKCLTEQEISKLLDLSFSKFGHLSIEALRMLQPYLEEGKTYDKACKAAGFDHKAHVNNDKLLVLKSQEITDIINDIRVPVVKRAVSQTIKVINAIVHQYGSPMAVNVELARELAKTYDERQKIKRANDNRFADNERLKSELSNLLPTLIVKPFDIVKYRLYQEQAGKCAYSQKSIEVSRLTEPGYVEVDHIIPYSRCNIDSYNNKVLVLTAENQAKLNRTPYEYMGNDPARWSSFEQFVTATYKNNRTKTKYLLIKNCDEQTESDFKESNLNDTKYISRFMYNLIKDYLQFAEGAFKQKVLAVNGTATSYMRKAWGVQKVRSDGDTHHAIDAAVIACATQGIVNRICAFNKRKELYYYNKDAFGSDVYVHKFTGEVLSDVELLALTAEPYYGFNSELRAHLSSDPSQHYSQLVDLGYTPEQVAEIKPIFVSRMSNHKAKGQIHGETIRSAKHIDEGIVVTKVSITKLELDKDGEIKNYYNKQSDLLLYNALRNQLAKCGGKGSDAFVEPFYKPKSDGTQGNMVRSVKVIGKASVGMVMDKTLSYADNGGMVRSDVFTKNGKNYIVPVYVKDVYSGILPNKAICSKPYAQWPVMDDSYQFKFSLHSKDLIYIKAKKPFKLVKTDKSKITQQCSEGYMYYVGIDSATGNIGIHNHDNSFATRVGSQGLLTFEKCTVDVLGNITHISCETRQPLNMTKE